MRVHDVGDGLFISEILIDMELERKKGRVSRGEIMELAKLAAAIRDERDHAIDELAGLAGVT